MSVATVKKIILTVMVIIVIALQFTGHLVLAVVLAAIFLVTLFLPLEKLLRKR